MSFNLGCVRLTERFLHSDPPSETELLDLEDLVAGMFNKYSTLFSKVKGKKMIAVAGTPTYLSSAAQNLSEFIPEKIHGSFLSVSEISALIEKFSSLKSSERLGLGGMDAGRADVIIAGAIILREVLRSSDMHGVEVSTRGLRYGLVLNS